MASLVRVTRRSKTNACIVVWEVMVRNLMRRSAKKNAELGTRIA